MKVSPLSLAAAVLVCHGAPVPEAVPDPFFNTIALPAITGSALVDGLLLGKVAFLKAAILANLLLGSSGGSDELTDSYGAPDTYGVPEDTYGPPTYDAPQAYEAPQTYEPVAPSYDPAPQSYEPVPQPYEPNPVTYAPYDPTDSYGAPHADPLPSYGAPYYF